MASRKADASGPQKPMSYEQAVAALETLIDQIERGDIGLEESLAAYKRGMSLIKHCREILEKAEQEIAAIEVEGKSGASAEQDGGGVGP